MRNNLPYKNQFGGISSLQNADDSDQKGRPEKVDHYPCSKKRSEKPLFFMAKYRDFGWIML
ncbi:hypothetical protein GCM10025882_35310 [Acinetobacter gyllenbergii]|uniref:hypothetical protein n=1 Tax=Acinetobacter gyllenbergii TaxID=134534 RepID=UPI0005187052|nr:hypothetical protein [Acinetobacter gyllenbergii]GMA13105.1 hypothetical protein GCM10025882_35310 [Acinetobacter gyllenbergii]